MLVQIALEGGGGGEYANSAGAGVFYGGFDGGFHPNDGGVGEGLPQMMQGRARGGVARDDDEFGVPVEQELGDVGGEGADFL